MAGIQEYLDKIRNAVYGRDVRQAIYDGIETCYKDGKAGAVDLVARQEIAELVAPSGEAPSAAEVTDARIGADGTTYTSLGLANRTQFTDLKSDIAKIADISTVMPTNLLDINSVTTGKYITPNGVEYTSTSYAVTDYIPVEVGKTYTFQTGTDATFETRSIKGMRFIAAYDASKAVMSSAGAESVTSYTVPSGIAYIRMSVSAAYFAESPFTYPEFCEGITVIQYTEYFEPYIDTKIKPSAYSERAINGIVNEHIPMGLRYKFNLNNDYHQFDDDIQDIQDYVIAFRGAISSFVNISIYRGYNETYGGRIYITNTDVTVYLGTSTVVLSAQHGLTIEDYIHVILSAKNNGTASIKIYTNGGVYSNDNFAWDCRKGKLMVATSSTNGSTLTDCELSYFCKDYAADTQLYGDSYFSSAHTNRWTSYLNSNGYTNFLLNAFPGRNSATALASLKQVLECSNPKRIIWCLGMNDGDDNGGIDVSWKMSVEEVMQICESRAIELILATIPNVPTIDHSAKNAYVRASEYRYIDFASAVGASSDTTWYDGMLDDGVHPTIQGAIALFTQAIADVPELMQ